MQNFVIIDMIVSIELIWFALLSLNVQSLYDGDNVIVMYFVASTTWIGKTQVACLSLNSVLPFLKSYNHLKEAISRVQCYLVELNHCRDCVLIAINFAIVRNFPIEMSGVWAQNPIIYNRSLPYFLSLFPTSNVS